MRGALLWKRILNESIGNRNPADFAVKGEWRTAEDFQQAVVCATIIIGQPVHSGDVWLDKFKGISLPFSEFWIEGEVHGDSGQDLYRIGAFIKSVADADGWMVRAACVNGAKDPPCLIGEIQVYLHANGDLEPVLKNGKKGVMLAVPQSITESTDFTTLNKAINVWVDFIFSNLVLLSCKNVGLSPRAHDDPKQARRAAKRHGGNPEDYRYHTLVVRPPGAKAGDKSKEQEIGIMPRHVCRGHFAEYGPEFGKGLLFGQHAGRFFIPPHLKGDKKNGVVEKDYQVGSLPVAAILGEEKQ